MSGGRSRATLVLGTFVLVVAGLLGAGMLYTHVVGRTSVEPPPRPAD